ncbi:insulin-induced protein-domain-containing protein, partial [Massariosphaeria phaeospora]
PPPHIYRPIARRNFSSSNTASHAATSNTVAESAESPNDLWPQSTPPALHESYRSSEFLAQLNARLLRYNARNGNMGDGAHAPPDGGGPARNQSLLNLTGSTLYGIYDDVGASTADERSMAETPWGGGAETPARGSRDYALGALQAWENGLGSPDAGLGMKTLARRQGTMDGHGSRTTRSPQRRRQGVWRYAVVGAKLAALFLFGVVYGVIVLHLHDTRELAAVRVRGVDHVAGWRYCASWGLAGVLLGSLLPWVDVLWDSQKSQTSTEREPEAAKDSESSLGEQWNDVVRSVGAFFGIAFAIRRLPWQSTLQLTITLALVNPALWYILDRSKPGLSFSLIATSILTSLIFLSNPDVLPSPALPATTNSTHTTHSSSNNNARTPSPSNHAHTHTHYQDDQQLFAGIVSYDNLAVATWVGSVLFCSCVCFGNIGRRLAVLE